MSYGATGTEGAIAVPNEAVPAASALQQIAAERLAAHRNRKAQAQSAAKREMQAAAAERQSGKTGAARVREAVAARYESSVSYREFLASETERALERVQAAAEIAARGAQAAAEAQMRMMQEMEQWNRAEKERVVEEAMQEAMQEPEAFFAPPMQASYNWNCCGLSVEYRKYDLGTVRDEGAYRFNFTLANIGTAGNLRRADALF